MTHLFLEVLRPSKQPADGVAILQIHSVGSVQNSRSTASVAERRLGARRAKGH